MEHDSWLLDFNCLPNNLLCNVLWLVPLALTVGVRKMEEESWLLDFNCLMPFDVSVLWLILMVMRVGLHCDIVGIRELVACL